MSLCGIGVEMNRGEGNRSLREFDIGEHRGLAAQAFFAAGKFIYAVGKRYRADVAERIAAQDRVTMQTQFVVACDIDDSDIHPLPRR